MANDKKPTLHALRGAIWVMAAWFGTSGLGNIVGMLCMGLTLLVPAAASVITVASAALVLLIHLTVVVAVLRHLARPETSEEPRWRVIGALGALGVVGIVFSLAGGWAQSFLLLRLESMSTTPAQISEFSMVRAVAGFVSSLASKTIDIGALLGAVWLWRKRRDETRHGEAGVHSFEDAL